MTDRYRFGLLGPLVVERNGEPVRLGGVKQRSVLAILLLHEGQVVSTDRLIDELWGERPPDDAATALHAHVSRLRRALAPAAPIETRAPGYVIELERGDLLDVRVFDALRAQAAASEPTEAARLLREALALWRGPPLADVALEPFARAAVEALEEARLDALEARIDADLALGRESELVPELARLVAEQPLRERLRAQQMLALYRAGRQAAALAAFREARARLVEELGIEPGPELRALHQRILEQDAALGGPRGAVRRLARRRRGALMGAAAALAAGATLTATLVGEDDVPEIPPGAGTVLVLDADTGDERAKLFAGRAPQTIAAAGGAGWVLDSDGQTVSRIAPGQARPLTFATGATPIDLAVGAGAVWVAHGGRVSRFQGVGPVGSELVKIDPEARTVRARTRLPRGGGPPAGPGDGHVAVAGDSVWAIGPDGVVARLATSTGAAVARVRGFRARAVAAEGSRVWLLSADGEVALVDAAQSPRTLTVRQRLRLEASAVAAIAAGDGAAFVTAPGDGVVWRVSGRPLRARPIPVAAGVTDVAFGGGHVWTVSPLRGLLARLHPRRALVDLRVPVGGVPRGVATDGDAVWVARSGDGATSAEVAGALPADRCGRVITAAGARPSVIVAVDLPLQGGLRVSPQQVAQAVELVARERGFRAGRHRIGIQVCDDSLARTGAPDPVRCAENGRLFARRREVVAVIGPLTSACAVELLPEAARGPVAVVSPFAGYVGLTRAAPGTPPGELARLYPGRRRHFLRVFPPDDAALAALAVAAAGDRVAIADDGRRDYGRLLADGFAAAARARGLEVAGRVHWDPQRPARVAARLARLRPEAVFLGGLLDTGGAEVVRAVRRRLGPDVRVLVTDGFTPTPLLVERAGAASRGVLIAVTGLLPETLGGRARRFSRRLETSFPGVEAEPPALYAAAAAQVVLDAIARSDGTRAHVLRTVFATRLPDSPVGPVAFTPAGDPQRPAVTLLRVEPGEPGGTLEATVIERVVRP